MNAKGGDKRIRLYKGTYWKACRAYTEAEFERHMTALRRQVPEAARVMDNAGKERWSNAYFQGTRFDVMTSNSAESVNAVSRFARRLPIVALLEFFRDFQQEWYLVRRQKGDQMQNPLTPNAEDIIRKRAGRSMSWRIRGLEHNRKYEVGRDHNFAIVDMENNTCTCREWDKSGLPCGHAIVVARHNGRHDCSHLAWNYFRSETYRKTYEETIWPAGPSTSWVFPEGPLMPCHPPLRDRQPVGRPRSNNRRPSRGEGPIMRLCGRCGAQGHTQGQCSIPAPSSMPRNRGSTSGTSNN